jgi:hypothetical protein
MLPALPRPFDLGNSSRKAGTKGLRDFERECEAARIFKLVEKSKKNL